MIKNFVETIKVSASFLLDMKDVSEDAKKALVEYVRAADGDGNNKSEKRKELLALMPEKLLMEAKELGVELPVDIIELNMKLGDFFYSLYSFHAKPIQAPLAIKRHERRLMELAEIFGSEEFEIPDYAKSVIVEALSDEVKWKESQFSAFVNVVDKNGEKHPKYIGLTSMGASFFVKIVNAASEAVDKL